MNIPEDLLYSKDHEWIKINGTEATIGITDFAQQELGDIVYVEIDKEGEEVEANDTFGSVEAVKTVSDLFMPITGTVKETNELLESSPEKINEDPYNEGWVIKASVSSEVDTSELLNAEAYKKLIGEA
ncbi:MAG: glycine cleavage system protein GcvH [Cyclobacteriaceae bacterium]